MADKDHAPPGSFRRAYESITLASCFSILSSCIVMGLLLQAALRGAGLDPADKAKSLPKPRFARQLVHPSPYRENTHAAPTISEPKPQIDEAVEYPIITADSIAQLHETAISNGTAKASSSSSLAPTPPTTASWRIEGREGVVCERAGSSLQARFPSGIPASGNRSPGIVLINQTSFPANTRSLVATVTAFGTSDSIARARALRVRFGCLNTSISDKGNSSGSSSAKEAWYGGVLLHTVASSIARGMRATASVPLPKLENTQCSSTGFDRVRIENIACDQWGHLLQQKDCDPENEPSQAAFEIHDAKLSSDRVTSGDCTPLALLAGTGWSCELEPSCPLQTLYSDVYLPPGGRITDARERAIAESHDVRLVPDDQMGTAQGLNCQYMLDTVRVGCLLSRGSHTHKAVHRGVLKSTRLTPSSRDETVVIKQGGLRFPPPFRGERAVGFQRNESAEEQAAALSAMFFEQVQEILALEHLKPHPGIPHQFGACIDTRSKVATSIQSAAQIELSTKKDLKTICSRHSSPAGCAFAIANSTASLFKHLTTDRAVRVEDLHYGEDFASPETVDAAYGSDDVSQFAIDDEENLNVVLIDIDKLSIDHNPPSWFVQQYQMPFVAQRLYDPLTEFLPGLEYMKSLMQADQLDLRPTSFECLEQWFASERAQELLASSLCPDISSCTACPSAEQVQRAWAKRNTVPKPSFGRQLGLHMQEMPTETS